MTIIHRVHGGMNGAATQRISGADGIGCYRHRRVVPQTGGVKNCSVQGSCTNYSGSFNFRHLAYSFRTCAATANPIPIVKAQTPMNNARTGSY